MYTEEKKTNDVMFSTYLEFGISIEKNILKVMVVYWKREAVGACRSQLGWVIPPVVLSESLKS